MSNDYQEVLSMTQTKLDKAVDEAIKAENRRYLQDDPRCPHCGKPNCIPAFCPEFLKADAR